MSKVSDIRVEIKKYYNVTQIINNTEKEFLWKIPSF